MSEYCRGRKLAARARLYQFCQLFQEGVSGAQQLSDSRTEVLGVG